MSTSISHKPLRFTALLLVAWREYISTIGSLLPLSCLLSCISMLPTFYDFHITTLTHQTTIHDITALSQHLLTQHFIIYGLLGLLWGIIYSLCLAIFFHYAYHIMPAYHTSEALQPPTVLQSVSAVFKRSLTILFSTSIVWVLTFLGFMFLLPGIIIFVFFLFFLPAILFDNRGILTSLHESMKLVFGQWWKTFFLLLCLCFFYCAISMILDVVLLPGSTFEKNFLSLLLHMLYSPLIYIVILLRYHELKQYKYHRNHTS